MLGAKKLGWLTALWFLGGVAIAQKPSLASRKIPLSEGGVFGAAFSDSGDQILVEQDISSTVSHSAVLWQRVLSLWDANTMSSLATRNLNASPEAKPPGLCTRVSAVGPNRFAVCGAQAGIDILDSKTLETVKTFSESPAETIYDFVVDQRRNLLFVLSYQGDGAVHLDAYSLADEVKRSAAILPSASPAGRLGLVLEPDSGDIIAHDTYDEARWGHSEKSHVYLCFGDPLSCVTVASVAPISGMDVLGHRLLYAVQTWTTDKKDCIYELNLTTKQTTRPYCSPQTGVRFAVGVIEGQYIAGFTGYEKTDVFQEQRVVARSSVSVWSVENRNPVAVADDPTDYGISQSGMRISASRSKPEFLTYNPASNAVFVYSVQGP